MNQKTYNSTTGIIFLLITLLHFLRVMKDWPANIGGWDMPMWVSWLSIIVAGCLAYHGLKRRN